MLPSLYMSLAGKEFLGGMNTLKSCIEKDEKKQEKKKRHVTKGE